MVDTIKTGGQTGDPVWVVYRPPDEAFSIQYPPFGRCIDDFGRTLFISILPFGSTLTQVTFILFTSGFCQRLGFPPDVETAEAQRSRRLGLRRVSHWSVVSRKSHHNLEQVEARCGGMRLWDQVRRAPVRVPVTRQAERGWFLLDWSQNVSPSEHEYIDT